MDATIKAILDSFVQLAQNPFGLILLILLLLAAANFWQQRRDLAKVQGETKIDESDREITLELIRANDKFYTKIDNLTEALTGAATEQAKGNAITREVLDQESRRITMREEAIKNEHADRERMFNAQDHMAHEINASIQAVNNLAISMNEGVQRTIDTSLAKVAASSTEAINLNIATGLTKLSDTIRAEIDPMTDNLQLVLDQLKLIQQRITEIADQQALDSGDVRRELKQVSAQVGATARRLEGKENADDTPAATAAPTA